MARKKRQGNDIRLRWAIINKETSEPYDLTGRDIQLWMTSRMARFQVEDFDIRENVISWTFFGKDQSRTGIYNAVLIENCGVAGMHAVDIEAAVEIVEHTWQAEPNNDGAATGIDVEGIDLESQIDLGIAISRQDIVSALGYLPVSPSDIPTSLKDLEDDAGHRTVTDDEKSAWSGKSDFSGKYVDLSGKPDLTQFVKKTVDDLANYYLKSETYTKEEVSQLLSAITTGFWQPVSSLPEASADTFGLKIYLVPSPEPSVQNQKDEFITTRTGSEGNYTYAWEQIGTTAIDLSGFVTTEALNAALANYVTSSAFQAALAGKQDTISDLPTIRSRAAAGATAYQKPSGGIPASDIAPGVIPDVSAFITKTVNDLTNYYTKSQTYTQTEVNNLIGSINQFHYEIAASISAVSSPSANVLYLIGPTGSGADKYEEYVHANNAWVKIGDTSIDLSGYVTTQALNTALAGKQDTIADLAEIRSGASAGATAYQKPSAGIPASDLADPEAVFIIPVNLDTQTVDPSITYQDIVDAYNAGKVLAFKATSSPHYLMYATTVLSVTGAIALCAIKGGISGNSVTSTMWALSASPSGIDFQIQEDQIEVPEISTDIDTDGTSDDMTASPKAVKTFVEGKGYGTYSKPSGGIPSSDLAADAVPVIPVDTAIPSGGLGANVHYALGTLTGSVSITLDATSEVSGLLNIYSLAFTAGSTAPTITWPSSITNWAGNCLDSTTLAPVITGGNSYEVSIVSGMAVITEFVAS